MIINQIINLFLLLLGGISSFLPEANISSIPIFGEEIYSILTTTVFSFNSLLNTFPYGIVAWHMFLWVILPFEVLMLIAKFFMGNRLPANLN